MDTKTKRLILTSNNWQSFKNKIDRLSNKEKGDAFELLTQCYLKTSPYYTAILKNVWLLNEVKSSTLKKLNLPENDIGIDLIAETLNGDFWAIQSKYKSDESKRLTHKELSTFGNLTYVIGNNISFGLVCTTADEFSKYYQGQDKIGFQLSDIWNGLNNEYFSKFHALLQEDKLKILPIPYIPFPHQQKAINNAIDYFIRDNNQRGKLILPCGAGKSLTGYWLSEKLKAKNIIVAVPSLALVRQTLNTWLREVVANKKSVEWICVCSDKSIGKQDDNAIFTQDLGIPCTTDTRKIIDWLRNDNRKTKVIFTTYQSGRTIAEASQKAKIKFDFGVFDEAHKTVGRKDKLFSHLLFDENIKIKRRIFMTATERRYRGSSNDILSMENEEIYGATFDMVTFKEALECTPKILCDYKIITVVVEKEELNELVQKNAFIKPKKGKWNNDIEAQTLTALLALRKAMNKYPIKHAVTFHSTIAKAQAFEESNQVITKYISTFEKIETFHVTGAMPTAKRSKIINEFSNAKKALITNARCLTEGIDVPNIDCILFADPKKSVVDIVQAVGRALRNHKDKKYGYIILPVLTNNTNNELIIDDANYQTILLTIRALASNDERIIEYFKNRNKKRTGSNKIFEFDIDEQLAMQISLENFSDGLSLKIWNKLGKLSWMSFEEARLFVQKLNLQSKSEWDKYCRNEFPLLPKSPNDIPNSPKGVYKNKGWKSWGDWLGTGRVADQLKEWMPFEEARLFVQKLNLQSKSEWDKYRKNEFPHLPKSPNDIPNNPRGVYIKNGWKSWGDWLGTGRVADQLKEWMPFEEARLFVQKLNLQSKSEWDKYRKNEFPHLPKSPNDIPNNPRGVYINKGWKSWGDWLGTGRVADQLKEWMPFEEARLFVQKLNLQSKSEWDKYRKNEFPHLPKSPNDIPNNPRGVYINKGWKSWGDWLGTGRVADQLKEWMPFEEARLFVQKLNLQSKSEWDKYRKNEFPHLPKSPNDIPNNPRGVYIKNGWKSWGDWLGTGRVADQLKEWMPFEEARKFAHSLKLKNYKDWQKYSKNEFKKLKLKPANIPSTPDNVYKNKGWVSWGDWLDTGRVSDNQKIWMPFEEARKFVHSLKLKNHKDWQKYSKNEFKKLKLKPANIPSTPDNVYKNKGWVSWGDWLDTGRVSDNQKIWMPFEEARKFVHSLKLKNHKDWQKYSKNEFKKLKLKPANIPSTPDNVYKNKGWVSWGDWLDTGRVSDNQKIWMPFEEARKFVHSLKLKNHKDWQKYSKNEFKKLKLKPANIPSTPDNVYKNKGWVSWGDWLDTGRVSDNQKIWMPFEEARKFVHSLKLKNHKDWQKYSKNEFKKLKLKPANIPSTPDNVYKNKGWVSWSDWLGKTN